MKQKMTYMFLFMFLFLVGCGGDSFSLDKNYTYPDLDAGDSSTDAQEDVITNDTQEDVITNDVQEDITNDATNDVQEDVLNDVQEDIQNDTAEDVQEDVAIDSPEDVVQDVVDEHECIDTTNDPQHCGICGRVCSTNVCINGQCMYEELVNGLTMPHDIKVYDNFVYYGDDNGLYRYNLNSQTNETLASNLRAIILYVNSSYVYFLSHDSTTVSSIYRFDKSNSTLTKIIPNLPKSYYFTVLNDNIFVTTNSNGVYRYDMNGNFIVILTQSSGDRVVYPYGNMLYWANTNGFIYSYDKNTGVVAFDNVGNTPHGITSGANYIFWTTGASLYRMDKNLKTIDNMFSGTSLWLVTVNDQRVYWGDLQTGQLFSANFNGTQFRQVNVASSSVNGIDVNDTFVYYTDVDAGKVLRVSK